MGIEETTEKRREVRTEASLRAQLSDYNFKACTLGGISVLSVIAGEAYARGVGSQVARLVGLTSFAFLGVASAYHFVVSGNIENQLRRYSSGEASGDKDPNRLEEIFSQR